jgi:hypothetical protein
MNIVSNRSNQIKSAYLSLLAISFISTVSFFPFLCYGSAAKYFTDAHSTGTALSDMR